MLIDCDSCQAPPTACDDCVMSVLLEGGRARDLQPAEHAALDALAGGGLIPPLRMVPMLAPTDPRLSDTG